MAQSHHSQKARSFVFKHGLSAEAHSAPSRSRTPHLGARWAERLLVQAITPSRIERGRRRGLSRSRCASQGATVRGTRWGAGPVVYLVHGWGGNASQLGSFVAPTRGRRIQRRGSRRAEPRPLRSRADRSGQQRRRPDGQGARRRRRRSSDPRTPSSLTRWVGSRPAGAPARLAGNRASRHDRPAVRISDYVDVVQAGLGIRTAHAAPARGPGCSDRVGMPIDAVDLHRIADEIERPELLVIHDPADRETPYASAASLVSHWEGARLTTVEGLGHRRVLRDPAIIRQVVAFVAADELQEATA